MRRNPPVTATQQLIPLLVLRGSPALRWEPPAERHAVIEERLSTS